jgi:hypothetical protein
MPALFNIATRKGAFVGLQVLEAEYDAQKNIAPFLENRALRRVVQVRWASASAGYTQLASSLMQVTLTASDA